MPEEVEHRRVIGGIADIQNAVPIRIDVDAVTLSHDAPCHRELVVVPKPAKYPEIVDGGDGPRVLQRGENCIACIELFRLDKRQAGQPKQLVIRESGAGNSRTNLRADLRQAIGDRLPLRVWMPKGPLNSVTVLIPSKEASTILADRAIHGPHPSHLIAPAGRRGRSRNA